MKFTDILDGKRPVKQPEPLPVINRMKAGVARFGYASISITERDDHKIDCDKLAKETGTMFTVGTLCVSFRKAKSAKAEAFEDIKDNWNTKLTPKLPQRKARTK